ncbi:hypothetical protein L1085_032370 [Streptomyces sp. MSC1_001]
MRDDRRDAALKRSLRVALGTDAATGEDPGAREAEARALAAFRTARDAGLHQAGGTRPQDDWTPPEQRRSTRRSLRAALAAALASLTLGGVAIAAGALPGTHADTPAPSLVPDPSPSSTGPDASPAAPEVLPAPAVPDRHEPPGVTPGSGAPGAPCPGEGKRHGADEGTPRDGKSWHRPERGAGGDKRAPAACEEVPGAVSGKGAKGGPEKTPAPAPDTGRPGRPSAAHPPGGPRPGRH